MAPRHDPAVARAIRRYRRSIARDERDVDFAHLPGSPHVSLLLKSRAFHRPREMWDARAGT